MVNSLTLDFSGLKLQRSKSSFLEGVLDTTMIIGNPTGGSAKINYIQGQAISENGKVLGKFSIPKEFTIPPNGSVKVPLEISTNNSEILLQITNAILSRKYPVITLTGDVSSSLGTFPFTESVNVKELIPTT
jgi:hypothetical protein